MARDLQSKEREIAKLQHELQTATQQMTEKESKLTRAVETSKKKQQVYFFPGKSLESFLSLLWYHPTGHVKICTCLL